MVLTEKKISRQITRLYMRASWRSPKDVIFSFFGPVGAVLTNVGVPFFSSRALAAILQHTGQFKTHLIHLILVSILGVIANRIGFVSLMHLQATTMEYLHHLVFRRLLGRGIAFHTNNIGGKLVSDAHDFVAGYSILMMAAFNSGFSFVLMLISGLVIVTLSAWPLGVFLFVTVLITLAWAYLESQRRMQVRSIRLIATKNLIGHLSDSIVNAQTVKMFAREEFELKENARLNRVLAKLRHADWARAGRSGNDRAAYLMLMIILLLVFIERASATHPNVLSVGIFAFTYSFSLLLRLYDINTLTRQVEESYLQAAPVMRMLMEEDEVVDVPNAPVLHVTKGEITIRDIDFMYTEKSGEQNVFNKLSLAIRSGEKVGLIGPSGGGKTTLTRLLLRFDDVDSGAIEIDGQNIGQVTQTSLRDAIAYVPQEPLLFHRSIKENIAYGKPGATQKEIEKAAKLANAHKFIAGLSEGYDTIVGERGVKLSGGQRQRVAIARAILKNSSILVLDEATSALDSESEKAIQEALWELMKNRTALVIAHRLSTIQKMDRIVVLNEGKIAEEGSHAMLLKNNGLYAKLWKHQSGGFLED